MKIMAVFMCLGFLTFTILSGCSVPTVKMENTEVEKTAGETPLGSISKENP